MGNDLYHSHSAPPSSISSIGPGGVRAFSLPPPNRGSMKVSSPMRVMHPGLPAAMSRKSWLMTPCGKLYASIRSLDGHAAQRGGESPVAADHPSDEPFVREVVHAPGLPVALSRRVHQGEVPRSAVAKEPPFDRRGERLGVAGADEPAAGDGLAVPDEGGGLRRRAHPGSASGAHTHQPPLAWMTWPVT